MKLKDFIKKLREIAKEHGENAKVIMADDIPVVDPVFLEDFPDEKVVITDRN